MSSSILHTILIFIQGTCKSIETNKKEIEIFFGVQMKVVIIKMPQYKMYWFPWFSYERTAMTLKRYEKLRKFHQVTDNTTKDNPKNANDKLFKLNHYLNSLETTASKSSLSIFIPLMNK